MFLADNTPAPPFSAKAAVSGRPVSLQNTPGALLLIFHSYQTNSIVAKVIRGVRNVYPSPDQVLVVSVADLRVIPRFFRGTAKAFIKSAYLEASQQIPAGQNPADHIIIISDWSGALFEAYQVPTTNRHVGLVLINEAKVIAGSYYGAQPTQAALSLLKGD